VLQIFERRILRIIYSPINEDGIWRTRHNKRYTTYDELDTVKVTKLGRLRCRGQLFTMQELEPCRKLILHKPGSSSRVRKQSLRWLESVEEM
jgi:hypothetical protein